MQSLVQVGSAIKPFIYAAALERGLTLSTVLQDSPIILRQIGQPDWQPKNSPNKFEGPLRLRVGLGLSKNMIAIRTIKMAGISFTADFLQRFGFKHDQYFASASLALGTPSFTPLDMARAYAVFDNGGFLIDPYLIQKIENNNGDVIYEANPKIACLTCDNIPLAYSKVEKIKGLETNLANSDVINVDGTQAVEIDQNTGDIKDITPVNKKDDGYALAGVNGLDSYSANFMDASKAAASNPQTTEKQTEYAPRVISSEVAYLIRSALHSAIYGEPGQRWLGTSWRIRNSINRKDVGGKTGTTNSNKVAWYAGFGGNISTAVYIGFDNNARNLGRGESGSRSAMPIWVNYMENVLKDTPQQSFAIPNDIVTRKIDPVTGLLASPNQPSVTEYYIKGTEPKQMFIPQGQGELIFDQATMPNKMGDTPTSQELF